MSISDNKDNNYNIEKATNNKESNYNMTEKTSDNKVSKKEMIEESRTTKIQHWKVIAIGLMIYDAAAIAFCWWHNRDNHKEAFIYKGLRTVLIFSKPQKLEMKQLSNPSK